MTNSSGMSNFWRSRDRFQDIPLADVRGNGPAKLRTPDSSPIPDHPSRNLLPDILPNHAEPEHPGERLPSENLTNDAVSFDDVIPKYRKTLKEMRIKLLRKSIERINLQCENLKLSTRNDILEAEKSADKGMIDELSRAYRELWAIVETIDFPTSPPQDSPGLAHVLLVFDPYRFFRGIPSLTKDFYNWLSSSLQRNVKFSLQKWVQHHMLTYNSSSSDEFPRFGPNLRRGCLLSVFPWSFLPHTHPKNYDHYIFVIRMALLSNGSPGLPSGDGDVPPYLESAAPL
ncbi:hypothetical protein BJ138DRAFT_1236719 [Hygrophoropsis aurantiaca]|uniref:Uncharacterized protein n=1 Tax=Hygrophoropsis aurantiaca TaxID=72124 RepID=A0ACB7ZU33_9AGAM|nr:hypothetical protein BJ138DRAFT_1236719 [Hygrophoropsis aurantiaca]